MYSTPTLWAVGEALAPAHINTIFHGRRVPTQLEERKLSLEALVNPDLFTSPPNDIYGFGGTDAPGPHHW